MRHFFSITTLFIFLLTGLGVSCNRQQEPATPPPIAQTSHREAMSIAKDNCEIRYLPAPTQTSLNDPFEIAIDALADEDADIDINTEKLNENFTVTQRPPEPPEKNGERAFQQHLSLTIEPLWHGSFTLPEIIVSFSFKDHPPVVIAIPEQPVNVLEPSQADLERQLDDSAAKTPLNANPPNGNWLWWMAAALAFLAIVIASIILHHKKKDSSKPARAIHQEPPHLIALHRLEALLSQKLVEQGLFKEFYNDISEILRDYIEARFGIRAPEQTTEEFLETLRHSPDVFSKSHTELLNNFLNHTDLVKYARVTPSQADINQIIDDTRAFIRDTIPSPTPAQNSK